MVRYQHGFKSQCCCTMYVLASTKMLCALIVRVKLNYMNTAYIFSVTLLLFSELGIGIFFSICRSCGNMEIPLLSS